MTDNQDNLPNEIWLPIPNCDGLYEVSNMGRVKSYRRNITVVAQLENKEPVFLKCGLHVGYPAFWAYRDGIRKRVWVHAAVLAAFAGPRPEGMVCRHLNDKRKDNRLDNLAYGTPAENVADAMTNGCYNVPHTPKRRTKRALQGIPVESPVRWPIVPAPRSI